MFKEKLKQFVLDNPKLVSMKPAGDGLFVLKYTRRVFFDNLWNDFLEECRGTIVDKDFNVVSRPFTKVYNYGVEDRCPVFDKTTLVTAYRKINGFMACVTWHNGDILVSTTGSTDSDYVRMAKEMMLKHMKWEDWQIEVCGSQGISLMFECVHPEDPHIIQEIPGMYFLGWRENTWDSTVKGFGVNIANHWKDYAENVLNCYSAEAVVLPLDELQTKVRYVKHEGFVVYTEDNQSFKIKSPYYLTSKWVARNPKTDKLVNLKNDIKQTIDEEYYHLIDLIRENIEQYTAMDEQARLSWVREQLA